MVDIPRVQPFAPSGNVPVARENIEVRGLSARSASAVAGAVQAANRSFAEDSIRQIAAGTRALANLDEELQQKARAQEAKNKALATQLVNERVALAHADISRQELRVMNSPDIAPLRRREFFESFVEDTVKRYEGELPEGLRTQFRAELIPKSIAVSARIEKDGYTDHVKNEKERLEVNEKIFSDQYLLARSPEEKMIALEAFARDVSTTVDAGILRPEEGQLRLQKFGKGLQLKELELVAVAQPTQLLIHLEQKAAGQPGVPGFPDVPPDQIPELRAKAATALQQSVSAANALRAEEERSVKKSQDEYFLEILDKINRGVDVSGEISQNAVRLGDNNFKSASEMNYNRLRDRQHDAQRAQDRQIAQANLAESRAARQEARAERLQNQTNFTQLSDFLIKQNQGVYDGDPQQAVAELNRIQVSRSDKKQALLMTLERDNKTATAQEEAARRLLKDVSTTTANFTVNYDPDSDTPAKLQADLESRLPQSRREGKSPFLVASDVITANLALLEKKFLSKNPELEKQTLQYTTHAAIAQAQANKTLSKEAAAYATFKLETTKHIEYLKSQLPKQTEPAAGANSDARRKRAGENQRLLSR